MQVLIRLARTPWLTGLTVAVGTTALFALAAVTGGTTGVVIVLAVLAVAVMVVAVVAGPVLVGRLLRRLGAPGIGDPATEQLRLDLVHEEQRQLAARLEDLQRQVGILRDARARELVERGDQARDDGDHRSALDSYEAALVLTPDDPDLRRCHLETVQAVEPHPEGTRLSAMAVDRQLTAGHYDHARELVRHGLERVPHSLRLRDREVALLSHAGAHDQALALARETAELRCRTWQDRRPADRTPRHLDVHQRIAISGFFYSGSGAAKDHLRGYRGVEPFPPVGELRIIKFPGGFDDLGGRMASQGQLTAADLVDHYLHIVGRKITGTPPGVYDKWEVVNANSRRLLGDRDRTAGYLAACMEGFLALVDRVDAGPMGLEDLQAHARSTLQRAFDAAATDNDANWLVIDQVVTGWHLDQAAYLPPSSFVLVHRDPRDRFAEVRAVLDEPGRRSTNRDPRNFARTAHRHLDAAARRVPRLEELGHRVLRLAFEDLVLEPERTIATLEEHLGLTGIPLEEQHFHPERSRRNVGKHVTHVPPDELAVIERIATDLLDARAVPEAWTAEAEPPTGV